MAERKASRKNPGLHLSKKERSKIKIMHAAKGLFEEHGVGNVTFQMIADRADMCRTTIFNHFNGMDELMVALTAREVLDIQEYCEEYALHGMDLIYGLYDKLMEDTAYYPALASTLINDAITSKDGDNPIRIIEEMTVRGLEEAGDEDPEKTAILVEGAYYGIVNHCHVYNKKFEKEELQKEFRNLLNIVIGGNL